MYFSSVYHVVIVNGFQCALTLFNAHVRLSYPGSNPDLRLHYILIDDDVNKSNPGRTQVKFCSVNRADVVVESMCVTLKRIPHVFASFLESSAMWYFPLKCSSNKTPKNLIYFTLKMCFLPIFIEILGGIELAYEWNIIKLVLLIFNESLFASSHLFTCFGPLLTFLMTSSSDSES